MDHATFTELDDCYVIQDPSVRSDTSHPVQGHSHSPVTDGNLCFSNNQQTLLGFSEESENLGHADW